jgi:antitoxin component YwqK of YwqJK toxin-antitoxin module
MKIKTRYPLLVILLLASLQSWACCEADNRSLTQYLLEERNLTAIKCKILSTVTDSNNTVISKAVVLEVFLGNVNAKYIELNTGNIHSSTGASHYPVGATLLIFGGGDGLHFYCGGICDNRTQQLDASQASLNIERILRLFATISKGKKTGTFSFKNHKGKILSTGRMEKGLPTGLWKHYDNTGHLKVEYDYTTKDSRYFDNDGFLLRFTTHYKDSTVYMDFIDPKKGIARMREVEFPNDNGFVSVFYDYFTNGNVRTIEGMVYLKKANAISSKGKTGKFISYHENGKIRVIGQHEKDRRIGIWKWYEDDGTFTAEVDYKDGTDNQ